MKDCSAARFLVCSAGILGALAVLIGAFAAHGLEGWLIGRGIDAETAAPIESARSWRSLPVLPCFGFT